MCITEILNNFKYGRMTEGQAYDSMIKWHHDRMKCAKIEKAFDVIAGMGSYGLNIKYSKNQFDTPELAKLTEFIMDLNMDCNITFGTFENI